MNSAPIIDQYDLSSLKLVSSGAAPLPTELAYGVRKRLEARGAHVNITNGYGMTETSCASHLVSVNKAWEKMGSVGQLFSNLEARLVDDDGKDVPVGQRGEIWLRGPVIMK